MAGDRYALLMAGQPRTPQHLRWYRDAVTTMGDLVRAWGFTTRTLFPEVGPGIDGPSTRASVRGAIMDLGSAPSHSLLFLYAVGHGHFDGRQSWYLASDGPMASAEFRTLLEPLPMATMVLAFTPCQSGQFVDALAAPGRVVITSTEAREDNRASFAEALRDGLGLGGSVAEAFAHAQAQVEAWYRNRGIARVEEHPRISNPSLAATVRLRGNAQGPGDHGPAGAPRRVAFVCHGNAGRSPMAEAFLRRMAPGVHVESGGTEPGRAVAPEAVEAMAERGIDIGRHRPRRIPPQDLDGFDVVVTFGCEEGDVVGPGFRGKFVVWDVPNPKGKPLDFYRRIRDDIEARVKALVVDLDHGRV